MHHVFQIVAVDEAANKEGSANAVLIDRDNGLFATNAHVVNGLGNPRDVKFYIRLPHTRKLYPATFSEDRIEREADLACVRLTAQDLSCYEETQKRTALPAKHEEVWIEGYDIHDNFFRHRARVALTVSGTLRDCKWELSVRADAFY